MFQKWNILITEPNITNIFNILYIEMWNLKGRSGYSFDSIYKIYFASFLHRRFEVIQIWFTHQSTALIFYFGMKKVFSPIFEGFVGNRQTKFHILKFRVCKHTLNLNSWNVRCLFPTKFSKIRLKIFFMPKSKIGAFDWWVNHIYATFNFRCEKVTKGFC